MLSACGHMVGSDAAFVARVLIGSSMGKLPRFILLIGGCAMLNLGWQAHLGSVDIAGGVNAPAESKAVRLLIVGAIAALGTWRFSSVGASESGSLRIFTGPQ